VRQVVEPVLAGTQGGSALALLFRLRSRSRPPWPPSTRYAAPLLAAPHLVSTDAASITRGCGPAACSRRRRLGAQPRTSRCPAHYASCCRGRRISTRSRRSTPSWCTSSWPSCPCSTPCPTKPRVSSRRGRLKPPLVRPDGFGERPAIAEMATTSRVEAARTSGICAARGCPAGSARRGTVWRSPGPRVAQPRAEQRCLEPGHESTVPTAGV
jgi:hypothetical protein